MAQTTLRQALTLIANRLDDDNMELVSQIYKDVESLLPDEKEMIRDAYYYGYMKCVQPYKFVFVTPSEYYNYTYTTQ